MQTRWKATILTLAIAIPAFMLGAGTPAGDAMWRAIWPWDSHGMGDPSGAQVPFLMGMAVLEAVALGLAVSFLVWGRPMAMRMAGPAATTGVSIAVAWILGNWWIHDNLHIVNGEQYWGLITIEYAFHGTLIGAGAFLAWRLSRAAAKPVVAGAGAPKAPRAAAR